MSDLVSLLDALGGWLRPLASHVWTSTLFLAAVLVVLLALRPRLTAAARFSLALVAIAKFAVPAGLVTAAAGAFGGRLPRSLPDMPLQIVGGALPLLEASPGPRLWAGLLVALWLVVAALALARQALARHRLVALAVRTAMPPLRREIDALARARDKLGVRRSIDLARSPLPEAPAVVRIVRPLIVLPAGECDDLSDGELESLLLHEVAHVARHDNLWVRLEALVCALFWFHPLLWVARRITRLERERACDERVADAAGEQTYLAALRKFCHTAIAPRLPGVSCMATANLKERIEHVMKYAAREGGAPPSQRTTVAAVAALVTFTLLSGLAGELAIAAESASDDAYAVRVTATRTGDEVTLRVVVTENANGEIVAAPALRFRAADGAVATSRTADLSVRLEVRPNTGDRLAVEVAIDRAGERVQTTETVIITPDQARDARPGYSGEPITMSLKDANVREVLATFAKITGMRVEVDDAVQGRITVEWVNVPWDQALEALLAEQGLTYRIEEGVVHVSRR